MQLLLESPEFNREIIRVKSHALANVVSISADNLHEIKPVGDLPEHVITNGTMRIVYSVESQPVGLCHHLSISKMGKDVPTPLMVEAIMKKFGIAGDLSEVKENGHVWLEGPAVNILALL